MTQTCVNCKYGVLKWSGMGVIVLCMKNIKRCLGESICENWESDLGEEKNE